jgi:6-phosphogluconate dehydrogenase
MQIGMVGLGRMGGNMARRLIRGGHEAIGFAQDRAAVDALKKDGGGAAESLEDLAKKLRKPRVVWLMVPAGDATEQSVIALSKVLESGDIVIDGGNSNFKDDIRRSKMLAPKGIAYADVGTSGGVWGLERGYCLMIGGPTATVKHLDPILKTLAPGVGDIGRTPGRPKDHGTAEQGYLHCGPVGSGHFVKMVHNGIEYGIMQAYAEGFDLFRTFSGEGIPADYRYNLDLAEIAEVWRRGSVVSSWLLDLTAQAFIENPTLSSYSGFVQDSGEGRWTIEAAIEAAVPVEVLASSLFTRFRSRQQATFAEKVLSAMRHKFGGHIERPTGG